MDIELRLSCGGSYVVRDPDELVASWIGLKAAAGAGEDADWLTR